MSTQMQAQSFALRQREYLLKISQAMTSRLDLSEVLMLVIQYAVEMLSGNIGLIALRDERDDTLRIVASHGLPAVLVPRLKPFLNSMLPALPSDQWREADVQRRLALVAESLGIGLRQVVSLPLSIDGDLTGIIYVFRTSGTEFSVNDRQVLESFAAQAAIAVRNARLYQAAVAEKRRLDALIHDSADGVVILDHDERIVIFNRALSDMTGCPQEVAIGRPCREVLVLYDSNGASLCHGRCPLHNPGSKGKFSLEGYFVRPAGDRVAVSITYSPLYDEAGQLINTVANVRDVSQAREAEQLKSTLLSVISHELKTPVALIKGYASTLRREDADWDRETLLQSLAIIEEEADRLNQLINNLLDASRIQAGGLKLRFGYVRLDRLARKLAEEFRTQTSKHSIVVDIAQDLPPIVGDEERLREVISNLLSNAIKYSPKGGEIRVSGSSDAAEVRLAISDEGVGVRPEERGRIFDRFYRGDSAARRKTQGAGLGLFLVKAVVEAHSGRVWVDSTPAGGSQFHLALPRNQ